MTTICSVSPQHPDDVVVRVSSATSDGVRHAASRAREAQAGWAASPPGVRAAALDAAAGALAAASGDVTDLVVREVGKPVGEAAAEVARGVAILRYYAQQTFDPVGEVYRPSAGSLSYTQRRPRGVAGLITPWNFPVAIPLWKAAPALAFGNAALLKPAPQATAVALRLAEILAPHLPHALFTVIPGDAEAGRALLEASDLVSFTGSATVGRAVAVAAAQLGVLAQCEMGGQNPVIVLPDADIETSAAQIATASFGFAGQKCTATKRVIVVGSATEFVQALLAATEGLAVGAPEESDTAVGPVIDDAARAKVLDAAASARSAGGRVLSGGQRTGEDGYFVSPTIVSDLPARHLLRREEVFGPICAVIEASSVGEAVRIANEAPYRLAAAVYTGGLDAALSITDQLGAGQIKVNAPTTGVDFHLPFGGENDSSYGPREQGKAAREFYMSTRTLLVASTR